MDNFSKTGPVKSNFLRFLKTTGNMVRLNICLFEKFYQLLIFELHEIFKFSNELKWEDRNHIFKSVSQISAWAAGAVQSALPIQKL